MNTTSIHQALAPLVGHPLHTIGRTANMVWLHFGEMREVPTRDDGTKRVGDWAVHVQCPWRISQRGRIVIAYHDFYYSPDGDDLENWDAIGSNQFDSAAVVLCAEFETVPPVVVSAHPEDVGGFSLHFSHDYRLDVFPDTSFDSSEHWRIFQPGVHGKHFVFHHMRPWPNHSA